MIEFVIVISGLICVAVFLFGYLRGLEKLNTIQNWGIGFDNGWKAHKEFVKETDEHSIPVVPLDKLCKLLADMYHCPSSGYPSSGHACHPDCTDEMLATLCGTDCDHYSDVERWKAFLTNWMEKETYDSN